MCWLQQPTQLWYYPTFLLVPLMIVACIECFAGYLAWRFLLGLNGGILGFVLGAVLCMEVGAPMLVLFGALGGAVAGATLFAGIRPLGGFVFTFGSTASLAMLVGHIAEIPHNWLLPIAAFAGLVGAGAAQAIHRPAMIAIAAAAGAQQIVSAWCAFSFPCDSAPQADVVDPHEWSAFLALATLGVLIQIVTSRKEGEPTPVFTRNSPAKS